MRTVWGRGRRRRFALMDGGHVLAGAHSTISRRSSINSRCACAAADRDTGSSRSWATSVEHDRQHNHPSVVSPTKGDGTIGNSKTRTSALGTASSSRSCIWRKRRPSTGSAPVLKCADSRAQNCNDYWRPRRPSCSENIMLFIVGAVLVAVAIVNMPRMRLPGGRSRAHLGWMSEHWLAELHASHSS